MNKLHPKLVVDPGTVEIGKGKTTRRIRTYLLPSGAGERQLQTTGGKSKHERFLRTEGMKHVLRQSKFYKLYPTTAQAWAGTHWLYNPECERPIHNQRWSDGGME